MRSVIVVPVSLALLQSASASPLPYTTVPFNRNPTNQGQDYTYKTIPVDSHTHDYNYTPDMIEAMPIPVRNDNGFSRDSYDALKNDLPGQYPGTAGQMPAPISNDFPRDYPLNSTYGNGNNSPGPDRTFGYPTSSDSGVSVPMTDGWRANTPPHGFGPMVQKEKKGANEKKQ
ncbi:hypothetical protein PtB15_4B319 [Puccinia triticina]|nr:hypothetical protein PtB15_4B319 [Puccinia triticina]